MTEIVLASASPRRAELLASAGYRFTVRPADVDETPRPDERPETCVVRLARAKARAVATESGPDAVVLAADTVVVAGDELLNKPVDRADAARMLQKLSGTVHDVFTGVVVHAGTHELAEAVRTRVHFVPLRNLDIDWYINSGEPEGKAGAYAIQGRAARFIDRIKGSWSNVVGLPVATVHRLLSELARRGAIDPS